MSSQQAQKPHISLDPLGPSKFCLKWLQMQGLRDCLESDKAPLGEVVTLGNWLSFILRIDLRNLETPPLMVDK